MSALYYAHRLAGQWPESRIEDAEALCREVMCVPAILSRREDTNQSKLKELDNIELARPALSSRKSAIMYRDYTSSPKYREADDPWHAAKALAGVVAVITPISGRGSDNLRNVHCTVFL